MKPHDINRPTAGRLIRAIILETLVVAVAGMGVWGLAWEFGYPAAGRIAAIVIWLTVSPVIEIATIASYRRSVRNDIPVDEPNDERATD